MYHNYKYPEGLGIAPVAILGSKVAVSKIASVAASILPKLFQDKYAEANAAITQVNQLAAGNTQNITGLQQTTNQAIQAYKSTIAATNAKAQELANLPEGGSSNTMKGLLIATAVITVAGIAIDKLP